MELREFTESLKNMLPEFLPADLKEREFRIQESQKLNMSYTGLSIDMGDGMPSPIVNVSDFFERYNKGESLRELAGHAAEILQMRPEQEVDVSIMADIEQARDKIFFRVSSAERNELLLQGVPHQIVEDLAITYHVALGEYSDNSMVSALITNTNMKLYGLDQQQLHEIAMENTPRMFPPMVQDIGAIMNQLMGIPSDPGRNNNLLYEENRRMDLTSPTTMLVVSNEIALNGAGVVFYPDMQEKLAEIFQGDYFILPSSNHEVIVVPDSMEADGTRLKEMVTQINATVVTEEEKLTDEVYHYDSKDRVFERASSFEERAKNRAADREVGRDTRSNARSAQQMQSPAGKNMEQATKPKRHEMEL